jgi:hypothetical protein
LIDDWRLNIFRGMKENKLKLEANKIARRKCWETGHEMEECAVSNKLYYMNILTFGILERTRYVENGKMQERV